MRIKKARLREKISEKTIERFVLRIEKNIFPLVSVYIQLYKRQILYNLGKLFNEKRGFYGLFYV